MNTEYIWFKGGHPTKHTLDESGEQPTKLFLGGGVEIHYDYYPNGNVGYKQYYKHGKQHREGDKPAIISYKPNGNVSIEYYFKNGKRHRDGDMPAGIWYHENGNVKYKTYHKHGEPTKQPKQPKQK